MNHPALPLSRGIALCNRSMARTIAASMMACAAVLSAGAAQAQAYPTQTVRIVVPATPGGAIDVIARLVAEKMPARWANPWWWKTSPVRPTTWAPTSSPRAAPDGYTLVIVASSHATNKSIYKKLPYDPVKDFEPVVYTHVVPLMLAVNPSVPAQARCPS